MTDEYRPMSAGRLVATGLALLVLVIGAAWLVAKLRDLVGSESALAPSDLPPIPPAGAGVAGRLDVPDSLLGASGALRFKTLTQAEAIRVPGFLSTLGEGAIRVPAVHLARLPRDSAATFAYVVLRPFGEKRGDVLNGYRLGRWPAERWIISRNYFNPDGFVEVTPVNETLPLSAHFTLGDFLTHDQRAVWPKYVVLEEKLIDKLELVLHALERRGIPARRVEVLSGFRAPYYNDRGVGEGMARASRHQFGDAVDIIIDDDGNGRMDDLNRDGRLDLRDTQPITVAIGEVERAHPLLVGGLGTYQATGPRGPFAHIDVRGTSARWESGWWRRRNP